MRNSFLAAAALGATVLSAGAFAQVQHEPVDASPYNVSIKASLYWPIDTNLRHVDNMFGGIGAEYLFPTQIIKGSETFLELDALMHTTAGSNLTILPLTVNQRFSTKSGSGFFGYRGGRSYFYLGGGVTWIDPHGGPKLTFHGGIGTDLGPKIFTEAAIYVAEQDNHAFRNSGVQLSIGYRF